MPGRPREPIDLIIAKGKKNLTKQEIESRKEQEIKVPEEEIIAPSKLPKRLHKEFYDLSNRLKKINIFTKLDEEALSRYILSKDIYYHYTKKLMLSMRTKTFDIDVVKTLQLLQEKAFRQCQSSARDLGLTITSRCKIVMPPNINPPGGEEYEL